MNSFYSFYTKNFGKLSETAFELFWNGDYQRCYQHYNQVIASVGSVESLGLNDTLMYHHCSQQLGVSVLNDIQLPPPPNQSEIKQLYHYEASQEEKITKHSSKNILTQPSALNKAILAAFIGIENGCEQAIETGTFLGGSSYLFSGVFNTVDTIEADPRLHNSSELLLTSKTNNVRPD